MRQRITISPSCPTLNTWTANCAGLFARGPAQGSGRASRYHEAGAVAPMTRFETRLRRRLAWRLRQRRRRRQRWSISRRSSSSSARSSRSPSSLSNSANGVLRSSSSSSSASTSLASLLLISSISASSAPSAAPRSLRLLRPRALNLRATAGPASSATVRRCSPRSARLSPGCALRFCALLARASVPEPAKDDTGPAG